MGVEPFRPRCSPAADRKGGQVANLGVTVSDFAGSAVPVETIAAYLITRYRVWGNHPLVLIVGEVNAALASLYRKRGVSSAAVITAWNPRGEVRPERENRAAQTRLTARLDAQGFAHQAGQGVDPGEVWTPEDSRLVFGIGCGGAAALGRDFDQNAIVWAGADAAPRLAMLR